MRRMTRRAISAQSYLEGAGLRVGAGVIAQVGGRALGKEAALHLQLVLRIKGEHGLLL